MNWKKLLYFILLFAKELGQLCDLFFGHGQSKNKDGVERFMVQEKPFQYNEARSMKHKAAWLGGEAIDPDSGLHHQVHVIAREFIILYWINKEKVK